MARKVDWQNKQVVQKLVDGKDSLSSILVAAGLKQGSNNPRTLKHWAAIHGIQLPIYKLIGRMPVGNRFQRELSNEDLFCYNNQNFCSTVRTRIRKEKLLDYCCSFCNNNGLWNNQPLTLQIDHIDGNRANNCLTNLRYLCPNCHTQTTTYGSKARIKKVKQKSSILKGAIRLHKRRFDPTATELSVLVWEFPSEIVGKQFGVSGKSVEKRCKLLGVEKPGRGYWAKKLAQKNN